MSDQIDPTDETGQPWQPAAWQPPTWQPPSYGTDSAQGSDPHPASTPVEPVTTPVEPAAAAAEPVRQPAEPTPPTAEPVTRAAEPTVIPPAPWTTPAGVGLRGPKQKPAMEHKLGSVPRGPADKPALHHRPTRTSTEVFIAQLPFLGGLTATMLWWRWVVPRLQAWAPHEEWSSDQVLYWLVPIFGWVVGYFVWSLTRRR